MHTRRSKRMSKSRKVSVKRSSRTRKSRGSSSSRKNNKFFGLF